PAERVMPPVVYRLPGMENVRVIENMNYSETQNPHLLMDAYVPAGLPAGVRPPVALLIHGAGSVEYNAKNWGIFRSWGRLIAAAGMVGVTFTHRLGYPKPLLREGAADLRNAIEFVRASANSWNADADRMALVAWSGAGPLLANAMREKPAFIRCLAVFYAWLDIQDSEPHLQHESPEIVREFSPVACLETGGASMIPIFIARAGLDEIPTMNASIDRFVAAAISANAPVTFMNHPSGEHGFDSQNDSARSREIVRAALAFLRTHLGVADEQGA
ncbi:MAG: alpha/beta hydrolase, partial [Bryobacteraceae bacterium]